MTTLIDVLNNAEGREAVESLEDVISSLRSYPDGEKTLEDMRDAMIRDIETRFGFTYQL